MQTNQFTFGQTYAANMIAKLDRLMSGCAQHPYEFVDAWRSALSALSVVSPLKSQKELEGDLRACFPQLNNRYSA